MALLYLSPGDPSTLSEVSSAIFFGQIHCLLYLNKASLYLSSQYPFAAADRAWLATGHCSTANSHRSRHLPVQSNGTRPKIKFLLYFVFNHVYLKLMNMVFPKITALAFKVITANPQTSCVPGLLYVCKLLYLESLWLICIRRNSMRSPFILPLFIFLSLLC